jgi:hypothetical protein
MRGVSIIQWVTVVILMVCSLVLVRSCSKSEDQVLLERESQPLYKDVVMDQRAKKLAKAPEPQVRKRARPTSFIGSHEGEGSDDICE